MEVTNKGEFYQEVGRRIKAARNAKGLSQNELAAMVNLTRTSITNIEKGRQRFLAKTIWDISNALSIETSKLFPSKKETFQDEFTELPEKHQRVIEKLSLDEKEEGKNGSEKDN